MNALKSNLLRPLFWITFVITLIGVSLSREKLPDGWFANVGVQIDGLRNIIEQNAKDIGGDQSEEFVRPVVSLLTVLSDSFKSKGLTKDSVIAACLAYFLCILLPKRAPLEVGRDISTVQEHAELRGDAALKSVFDDYSSVVLRAAQSRCMIVYAMASFVAEVLYRIDLNGGDDVVAIFNSNRMHFVCIAFGGGYAAWWSSTRPARYFRGIRNVDIAMKVGAGGVFLGGAIALAISMPYRMSPGAAQLNQAMIDYILLFRLLLLPCVGFVASGIAIWWTRKASNRPL